MQMTASSWLGMQATKFAQAMQAHVETLTGILNQLGHVVETGKHNINAQVNVESE